jgi:nucleoside 2-deoxyribosyltransferase
MEYAPEGGRQWRERTRSWLQEHLNHRVYDPTEEARRILSDEELRHLPAWKAGDLERYRKVMRFVISHDLNVMANQADYVVCLWDEAAARGAGTQAEITAAFRKGIPVYLVTEIPLEQVSGWVLGCADKVLPNFEELKAFLAATYKKETAQRVLWERV